jgi:hypothetical protein
MTFLTMQWFIFWQYWGLNSGVFVFGSQVLEPYNYVSSPCSGYFGDRVSLSVGMTAAHLHAQIFCFEVELFCPGCHQTAILMISTTQGRITILNHQSTKFRVIFT